ncbi:MAG TPA: ABC transporter ATP-binding protein [Candidatus Limnocylindria bacterium]
MRIDIEGLTIRFRGGVEAVRDVGLSVGSGELVAVVGPSGCGKSTMLNAIAGLLPAAEVDIGGTVALDGADIRRADRRALALGYVFQRDALLPWATIAANVELGLRIRGVPAPERARRVAELIGIAGLAGFERYYPHQVSGGMRQRTSLIRTLAYEPRAILMDEPFGALDAQNRMILQSELLRMWERTRTTILFVTHDLAEAITLGQRVVAFSKRPGRVTGVFDVPIPGPRDVFEIRGTSEFTRLEREIWSHLREDFRA